MHLTSLSYHFRQPFQVPANAAYVWCTDLGPDDGALLPERTERTVQRLTKDALIMTDTTYPRGRPLRIRRLVWLDPDTRSWTNTHLDGPRRHSQFWYRIVPDGPKRSHLERGSLCLVRTARPLTAREIVARTGELRDYDAGVWRRQFAPAMERELRGAPKRRRRRREYAAPPPAAGRL